MTTEGLIYQLTYQHRVCFVYQETPAGFHLIRNHTYESKEGWGEQELLLALNRGDICVLFLGLTYDGTNLIMSDATDTLLFIDPQTFTVRRKLVVLDYQRQPGVCERLLCVYISYQHAVCQ